MDAAGLLTREIEDAENERLLAAGRVITAYQPRSIQDAATLLACVFMDEAAEKYAGRKAVLQGAEETRPPT